MIAAAGRLGRPPRPMRVRSIPSPAACVVAFFALAAAGVPATSEETTVHLVACAPGYPGSTEQAQPTMDEFAALIATAGQRPAGSVTAEYHETEEGGLERLATGAADLALVPLPFFLKHGEELGFEPLLQAAQESGSSLETWSLVAPAGRVGSPAALDGWELIAIPAYAPGFVRGPVLGSWGELPAGLNLTFSRRVLAGVRRALAGEEVAVLLDGAQTAALAALPGGETLEIVAESPPVLAALLVAVGERLTAEEKETLTAGLLGVHDRGDFDEILSTMRLTRFEPLDAEALGAARRAYAAALEALEPR